MCPFSLCPSTSLSIINTYITLAELYNAIYAHVLSRPDVAELTVEDPAEAFEDLRDRNDLKMLSSNALFMEEGFRSEVSHGGGRVVKKKSRGLGAGGRGKGKMGPPAEKGWVEKWRKDLKIAGVSIVCSDALSDSCGLCVVQRQFHRLVEMLIMLHLDPADLRAERAFRLQVKERLYRFNYVRNTCCLSLSYISVCSLWLTISIF